MRAAWIVMCIAVALATGNTFIHVTDIHYDPYYISGTDPYLYCHRGTGTAGFWGTNKGSCDTPAPFIAYALKSFTENRTVDYVSFTGNAARHDWDQGLGRSQDEVYADIQYVIDALRLYFPSSVKILPTFGNFDLYPHNQMPGGANQHLSNFAAIFSKELPESALVTFKTSGHYSFPLSPTLVAISLNTMYWFVSNPNVSASMCTKQGTASAKELEWLSDTLEKAKKSGARALIQGHVPPSSELWFSDCIVAYSNIVGHYNDTIMAQIFGHTNQDEFFLLQGQDKEISSVATVAPSFKATYNPAIREYTYDPKKNQIENFRQYFVDLERLSDKPRFSLEYDFRDAYGLPDFSIESWATLNALITSNATIRQVYADNKYVQTLNPR